MLSLSYISLQLIKAIENMIFLFSLFSHPLKQSIQNRLNRNRCLLHISICDMKLLAHVNSLPETS